MTTTIARQPQGIPVGGQFAPVAHSEPSLSLDALMSRDQALDLSTLVPGQPRTIGRDVHGIGGIDMITLTDKGPLRQLAMPLFIEPSAAARMAPEKRLLEMRYTLPAEANIRELYEFDDWSYRRARQAAQSGLEEAAGLEPKPWPTPASHLPDTTAQVDEDGNISFTTYETFAAGEAIDPDDFDSWASEYPGYTDPGVRRRLATFIQDSYHS
ncbi:hypothetical protein [Paenarthrobacter sp. YJN-5]|uniref:hypothetical protein n=1 Tax=Paenarthrobacter sp. YJN-5 TaxID=2735316 RepID=UPI0018789D7C|nr:hypothetical protein [Paenarthrobacter sp. YJN-5]QOT19297.1 hypothetical protein HMI59_21615 [Paenarthrobacter sp. YJN-5]